MDRSYVLEIAGTGECNEFFASGDSDAEKMAAQILNRDGLVFADQWDSNGVNDDDEPCKRLLIWASEDDAENNSGANALAKITTIGEA